MINWLRNKLHSFIFNQGAEQGLNKVGRVHENTDADIEGMRFTVMPARGGTIVQIRTYDRRKDESNTVTYVIPDGQDIAKHIGDIVSLELMRT